MRCTLGYNLEGRKLLFCGTLSWSLFYKVKKGKQIYDAEINTFRSIISKTRLVRVRNVDVRQLYGISDIIKFTRKRKKEWNKHEDNHLIKMAHDLHANIDSRNDLQEDGWRAG